MPRVVPMEVAGYCLVGGLLLSLPVRLAVDAPADPKPPVVRDVVPEIGMFELGNCNQVARHHALNGKQYRVIACNKGVVVMVPMTPEEIEKQPSIPEGTAEKPTL